MIDQFDWDFPKIAVLLIADLPINYFCRPRRITIKSCASYASNYRRIVRLLLIATASLYWKAPIDADFAATQLLSSLFSCDAPHARRQVLL